MFVIITLNYTAKFLEGIGDSLQVIVPLHVVRDGNVLELLNTFVGLEPEPSHDLNKGLRRLSNGF